MPETTVGFRCPFCKAVPTMDIREWERRSGLKMPRKLTERLLRRSLGITHLNVHHNLDEAGPMLMMRELHKEGMIDFQRTRTEGLGIWE